MLNFAYPSYSLSPMPALRHPASLFVPWHHPVIGHTDWLEGMSEAHFWPLTLSLEELRGAEGTLRVYGRETVTIELRNLQRAGARHPAGGWRFQRAPDRRVFACVQEEATNEIGTSDEVPTRSWSRPAVGALARKS